MTRLDGRARLGLLCLLGYVAISWAFRFDTAAGPRNVSLTYPFDTFSMYADVFPPMASHVLVRDAEGSIARVTAFSGFECETLVDIERGACLAPAGARIGYLEDEAGDWIDTHAALGADAEPIEIIRRTWQLPADGAPPPPVDCVIAICTASR